MDINIVLLPETESVYLLDGRFFEGDFFVTAPDEVVYITVLPLDARFMSYTVKLIGGKVASGREVALMCKIGEGDYALKLGARYSFIFSSEHKNVSEDMCCRFFYNVKGKHFALANEQLSPSLSGISEKDLNAFFADFTDIIKVKDKYFLIDASAVGHECVFAFKGGKIDNISVDG